MRTVVPIGGNVTPLLLGSASAVCLDAELECVALAFAVDLGDDDEAEDEDDPVLDDEEAVLWVGVPAAAPVVELELDDPPHAVSSSTSEPSPVATVHPLLRITSLSLQGNRYPGPIGLAGNSARERDVARRELDHVPLALHAVALRAQYRRAL